MLKKKTRATCARCGRVVVKRAVGLAAHRCPHGNVCVFPGEPVKGGLAPGMLPPRDCPKCTRIRTAAVRGLTSTAPSDALSANLRGSR